MNNYNVWLQGAFVAVFGCSSFAHEVRAGQVLPRTSMPHLSGEAAQAKWITSEERKRALQVRAEWMRKMGFSEEEIEEACGVDEPVDLQEELDQLYCVGKLKKITPASSVLESWAIRR